MLFAEVDYHIQYYCKYKTSLPPQPLPPVSVTAAPDLPADIPEPSPPPTPPPPQAETDTAAPGPPPPEEPSVPALRRTARNVR